MRIAAPLVVVLSLAAAPSWAAGGWYLLVPPRTDYNEREKFLRGFQILDTKPLAQWAQEGAYDSASECETVKSTHVMLEQSVYAKSSDAYLKAIGAGTDPVVLKAQRYVTENNNATVWAFMASRCIRSDDPRLRP